MRILNAMVVCVALASASPVGAAKSLQEEAPGPASKPVLLTPPKVRSTELPQCHNPIQPAAGTRRKGERWVYGLEMLGMELATVTIDANRRGSFQGQTVTEYRGSVDANSLVNRLFSLEVDLRSIVPDGSATPVQSMNRYSFRKERVDERQRRIAAGTRVVSKGNVNGKRSTKQAAYSTPTHDFITGFLLMHQLPVDGPGCAVIYTHRRVYTAWIDPQGTEEISTSAGKLAMPKYRVRYATNKGKKVTEVQLWSWPGADRVPYKIEGMTAMSPVAVLKSYRRGG